MKRRTETDGVPRYHPNVMHCSDEPMSCADCGDPIEPGDGYFTSVVGGKRAAYCTKRGVGRSYIEEGPGAARELIDARGEISSERRRFGEHLRDRDVSLG